MLFFGILLYIIENSEPESNTRNILGKFFFVKFKLKIYSGFQDGFWLAFITLTTLGYGDIYPRSVNEYFE
jgi:hypothetical protein